MYATDVQGARAVQNIKVENKHFNKDTTALFCMEPSSLYEAIQYMLIGRGIVASYRFKELITHKFNGFLIDNINEAIPIIRKMKNVTFAQKIGQNARSYMKLLMEPNEYCKSFQKIIDGKSLQLFPFKFERDFKDRRWIIREKIRSFKM